MGSSVIYWSIPTQLIKNINRYNRKLTRQQYGNKIPPMFYSALITEVIELAIVDRIYWQSKSNSIISNCSDDLLDVIRDMGSECIDNNGLYAIRFLVELSRYGTYGEPLEVIEERYRAMLDRIHAHYTCSEFSSIIFNNITSKLPQSMLHGISENRCLLTYLIDEPFIRIRYIYD